MGDVKHQWPKNQQFQSYHQDKFRIELICFFLGFFPRLFWTFAGNWFSYFGGGIDVEIYELRLVFLPLLLPSRRYSTSSSSPLVMSSILSTITWPGVAQLNKFDKLRPNCPSKGTTAALSLFSSCSILYFFFSIVFLPFGLMAAQDCQFAFFLLRFSWLFDFVIKKKRSDLKATHAPNSQDTRAGYPQRNKEMERKIYLLYRTFIFFCCVLHSHFTSIYSARHGLFFFLISSLAGKYGRHKRSTPEKS